MPILRVQALPLLFAICPFVLAIFLFVVEQESFSKDENRQPSDNFKYMCTVVTASLLISPEEILLEPVLLIEDGLIAAIGTREDIEIPSRARHLDFPGATLAPSFFDIHIHGAAGHDVMEATQESLSAVGEFLLSRGVGSFFPTTVTAPLDMILRSLEGLAKLIASGRYTGARPLGIHLEGPFLSHTKRGVHPPEHLLPPSVKVFDRMWQASEGRIRLLTVAPELKGADEFIAHAVSLGVRVSLGHSDADTSAARAGVAAGATSATHTFNAMRALDHRNPGILGVALTEESLFAEIICDGIHVDPSLVNLYWKAKGPERAILVTDAMSAAGMPDGTYTLGGFPVDVSKGKATSNGVLAGSILTLDQAIRNFAQFTGAPLAQVAALAARNPARMTGLDREVGILATGRRADIAVLDAQGMVQATILKGEPRQVLAKNSY
jgi:N-acetylglucosamine-6-phosphate deacetylase